MCPLRTIVPGRFRAVTAGGLAFQRWPATKAEALPSLQAYYFDFLHPRVFTKIRLPSSGAPSFGSRASSLSQPVPEWMCLRARLRRARNKNVATGKFNRVLIGAGEGNRDSD